MSLQPSEQSSIIALFWLFCASISFLLPLFVISSIITSIWLYANIMSYNTQIYANNMSNNDNIGNNAQKYTNDDNIKNNDNIENNAKTGYKRYDNNIEDNTQTTIQNIYKLHYISLIFVMCGWLISSSFIMLPMMNWETKNIVWLIMMIFSAIITSIFIYIQNTTNNIIKQQKNITPNRANTIINRQKNILISYLIIAAIYLILSASMSVFVWPGIIVDFFIKLSKNITKNNNLQTNTTQSTTGQT